MLEEKRLEMIRMRTCRLFCMGTLYIYCLFRKQLRIFQAVYRACAKSMDKRGEFVKEPYAAEYYVV